MPTGTESEKNMRDNNGYSVEMIDIVKHFGGVQALKGVTVRFKPGEIHSVVGENGAGKSTLIKILSGAYLSDSGSIFIDGQCVEPKNTFDMKKLGVGVIYQEFALAQDCTVAENVFIHKLSNKKNGFINWKELNRKTGELIKELGFDIDPTETVGNLSVAYQQIIEITKALSEEINVLILDEPTAVLSPNETKRLFEILENLKQKNVTIIYISHRLEDVLTLSDQITVLRDGEFRKTFDRGNVTGDELVTEMIGRRPETFYPKRGDIKLGEEVLRAEHLSRGKVVNDVSFGVRKGEVLGIAGLLGSGKSEIARIVFGADKPDGGEIFMEGRKVVIRQPYSAIKKGINYLSENRKNEGVLLSLPIEENITLSNIRMITRGGIFLDRKKEKRLVEDSVLKFTVKCGDIKDPVNSLSGGNQQKVSIAKTLFVDTKVVILDEPTRGVDVGAKIEIYKIINEMAAEGIAVIIVSSEIEEIVNMCDRVVVVGKGKVRGELGKKELEKERIVALSAGIAAG